jgi:RNA recognition motif-containing protein
VTTLLVGNLSSKTTAGDLQTVFAAFGDIASIRVACDSGGHTRGFALVDLEPRAAAIAMQTLKGKELKGQMMDVVINHPLPAIKRQKAPARRSR